jgi:hypothetical protein
MPTYRSAVVHLSIDAPPEDVVAFLSDLENWKTWAPWITSVTRDSSGAWVVGTDDGGMTFRFGEPNTLGVLDHDVTLASGVTVHNALRVVPNGTGSELAMVLLEWPHMASGDFERDVSAVNADFDKIKHVIEKLRTA